MSRIASWLRSYERKLFDLFNQRMQHTVLDYVMNRITHLGGATFTISISLLLIFLANEEWSRVGWQCLVALIISHIPVAIIKRIYPRLRPYLVLPEANRTKYPLKDHSFPSGHTTAVFSIVNPIVVYAPLLALLLIPIAVIVGISRIYLGLHYPSDVAAGIIIAALASIASLAWVG